MSTLIAYLVATSTIHHTAPALLLLLRQPQQHPLVTVTLQPLTPHVHLDAIGVGMAHGGEKSTIIAPGHVRVVLHQVQVEYVVAHIILHVLALPRHRHHVLQSARDFVVGGGILVLAG